MFPAFPTVRIRSILLTLSIGLVCHVWTDAADPDSQTDRPAAKPHPNVVLILVDDLGLHDISMEGSQYYRTPNIDALAQSGMRFTAGYANCRVCSPSRASIQLGTFPARHGITQWIGAASGMNFNRGDELLSAEYRHDLPSDPITLPEALRANGYKTFFAGKWHLGGDDSLPTDHGFDINVGGHHRGSPPGGYFSPYQNPKMADGPAGESLTIRLAEETVNFIDQTRDQPYFAMLSFYAVHAPVQTTRQLWEKYRAAAPPAPADGNRFKIDRTLPVRQVQDHPVYAGMMETLDTAVGLVIEELDATGDLDNTILIFTGDNGGVSSGDNYATSNLPLRGGKGRQWEGGIREPYYISYPPMTPPGSTSDVPVTGSDLYPTILDLAGLPLKPEQHLDGRSLAQIIAGKPDETLQTRSLIWHYPHHDNQGGEPSSLIRRGNYKLIHYYSDGHDELYDLASDGSETTNIAAEQPERTKAMRTELMNYLTTVDAKFPERDPRYDAKKAAAKWAKIQGPGKASLEAQHAAFLKPDWKPNADWWGSTID